MKKYIYVLTTVLYEEKKSDTAIVGMDDNVESLTEAVLNNSTDLFEKYYDFAVIEKVPLHPTGYMLAAEQVAWFKCNYLPNNEEEVEQIEQPEWAEGVFNFYG